MLRGVAGAAGTEDAGAKRGAPFTSRGVFSGALAREVGARWLRRVSPCEAEEKEKAAAAAAGVV